MLYRTTIASPIGVLTALADDAGLVGIRWDTESEGHDSDALNPVDRHLDAVDFVDVTANEHDVLDAVVRQLTEYFDGQRRDFDLPLHADGTTFQRQAWSALRKIPFGETVSYGEQAGLMGDRKKARAVGAANGKNPIPIIVPCHRVVGSNGHLTGFAGGLSVKAWLLNHELTVRAS
jgi:methylated-DNA-[protein]-cysteine S-methyltransferase